MKTITWEEFENIELRVGTIVEIEDFPEAKDPAYKMKIDFGEELGIKTSSSQITHHYTKEELLGQQVIGVVNFPPKKVGKYVSECLVTGFKDKDGDIVIARPDKKVPNGEKLY